MLELVSADAQMNACKKEHVTLSTNTDSLNDFQHTYMRPQEVFELQILVLTVE